MASSKDTRVLFVPYRPGATNHKTHDDGEISQQKHAAREYHRKAKQRRQTLKQSMNNSTSQNDTVFDDCSLRNGSSSLPLSPRTLLGAGRVDPMNSLPISDMSHHAREMLDFSLTYQWTVFSYCNPGATKDDMKRHVMGRIMSSATSLYAIVFAGATYYALRRPGTTVPKENLMLRLHYKTRALRNMMQEIEEIGPKVPNETLYTMQSLAAFGAAEKLQPLPYTDNDSPLAIAHDLDFYSRLPCEWAHSRALFHLLKQRGGLPTVSRPGFATVISLYDVLTSFQRLKEPAFPLVESANQAMISWPLPEGDPLPLAYTLGIGFKNLCTATPFIKFNTIVGHIAEITFGWDRCQRQRPDIPPLLHQILRARHAAIHDLLCLPDRSDNARSADECLYELCRLGTLAYMLIFLYPLHRDSGPHEELSKRLMLMLDTASSLELWTTEANFLLWATMMGGIMAKETPMRHWFVDQLNNSGVKHTLIAWPPVSSLLSNYLWLESECNGEERRAFDMGSIAVLLAEAFGNRVRLDGGLRWDFVLRYLFGAFDSYQPFTL